MGSPPPPQFEFRSDGTVSKANVLSLIKIPDEKIGSILIKNNILERIILVMYDVFNLVKTFQRMINRNVFKNLIATFYLKDLISVCLILTLFAFQL